VKHRRQYIVRRAARNLRERREELGLRQCDVAERMRVSTTTYARLERGDHDSGLSQWLDAMWALDMAPDALLARLDARVP
jgi:transcriptional regulator with XRE-family HTH domain